MTHTIRWKEYMYAYAPVIVVWIGVGSLLALPKYSVPNAICQAIFIVLWSYGGHVLAHAISNEGILSYVNSHVFLHHKKSFDIPRWLELVIEACTNFLGFFIIIILQKFFKFEILSPTLVLGGAFLYIFVHILDYSIVGNENHKLHHARTFCNYDPEFLDALFGTLCNPDAPYSDMTSHILFGLAAFSLAKSIQILFRL